jgi:Rieske Fe-S protein
MDAQRFDESAAATTATVWPIGFAVGVAVLLIGLIVNPEVIAPLGGAITILAGFGWLRGGRSGQATSTGATRPKAATRDDKRYPRSRFLERATLGLGGVVAAGVALPAAGLAILPSFVGQRRRPVDLGPIGSFPEGRFVIATFLADPRAGEVSRRAAYIRNNGLLDGLASFTTMSSRCTHVGCPTQPNGPVFNQQHHTKQTANGPGGTCSDPAGGRVRLSLPRQPVRHGRQPHRGSGRAGARPLRVLDPERPSLARPPVQRQPRGRHRRDRTHPSLPPPRPRRACQRSRVVAVPGRPDPMSIYELDISWALTAGEARRLRWELIACEEVKGVFLTARDDVLAVLYGGEHRGFEELTRALAPQSSGTPR